MKKRGVKKTCVSSLDLDVLRQKCEQDKPLDPQTCEQCLTVLQDELHATNDTVRELELLRFIINCCMSTSRLELAESCLKQVLALVDKGLELPTVDMVYNSMGRIELSRCKYPEAAEHFQKALELSENLGKADNAAGVCMNLSGVYNHLGRQDISMYYIEKAIEILGETRNLPLLNLVKSNYSNMLFSEGKLEEALKVKRESIAYYEEQNNLPQVAKEKNNLASLYNSLGKLEQAIATILESLKIREELCDEAGVATNWLNLGVFYRELGKDESALDYFEKALAYNLKVNEKHSIPLCLNNIGNYYMDYDQLDKALEYLLEARKLKLEIEDLSNLDITLDNIAIIYKDHYQDYRTAHQYLLEALEVNIKTQDIFNRCRLYLQLASVQMHLSSFAEAEKHLELARQLIEQNNYDKLKPDLYKAKAELCEAMEDHAAACMNLKEYNRLLLDQHKQENIDKIAEMQTRYETERKEKEAEIYRLKNIELESKNREIEEQKNELQDTLNKLQASEIRYNFVSEELVRSIGTTLVGRSEIMKNVSKLITLVAKSENTNVMITGETGTGKEIVARSIHATSHRGKQHFYAVNCSAITETLFESQFFGHEKDAFTGANNAKPGWFEIANHSTLFLDEIGTLSYDQQAKLLRALEEHCIVRVGSHREIPFNVRVISATNLNLTDKVSSGEFRRDLFHRLAIFVINIPALRDRKEDIPLLLKHFLGMASQSLNKKITRIDNNVLDNLLKYDFPGNVRELKNMVERAVLVSDSSTLRLEHFNIPLARTDISQAKVILPLEDMERELILMALKTSNFNRVKAAKMLKVDRKVVERKILKHGIVVPD